MKALYIDCSAGISGDMTLGALLDLGVPESWLRERLALLGVSGWEMVVGPKMMRGISCTDVRIVLDAPEISEMWEGDVQEHGEHEHPHPHGHGEHEHPHPHEHEHHAHVHHSHEVHEHGHHPHKSHEHAHAIGQDVHSHVQIKPEEHDHRSWAMIRRLILSSGLDETEKGLAIRIFTRIAVSEAAVHGMDVETVSFHEVGAVDSIVDIVGVAICLAWLKPDRVFCSPVTVGSGFVRCQHGLLPVPAPATSRILTSCQAVVQTGPVKGELTTPTGAAILAGIADEFGPMPAMRMLKTAYGSGKKDFGIPNVLRLVLGEVGEDVQKPVTQTRNDAQIWLLEANIDDMSGEIAGHVMGLVLEAGVRDCFHTPIYMKKNRPGVMLSVLVDESGIGRIEDLLFRETSTIGIRRTPVERSVMERSFEDVSLPEGIVTMKVCRWKDIVKAAPEFESLRALSEQCDRPVIALSQEATAAWLSSAPR